MLIVFLSSLILFPVLAQAISLDNPLQSSNFEELITSLINIIWTLALIIAPLMIIVAGFYFVTAAGNPNQITIARQIILWTLIGFLVIASAIGIINLFNEVIKVK